MTDVDKAMAFAIKAHGEQTYGHHHPYSKHLNDVLGVAEKHWLPLLVRVAAPLHDVLEDTFVSYEELSTEFGVKVANLVQLVTDKLPGATRHERHVATYPGIAADTNAIALKLCDRISNVRACTQEAGHRDKFKMYQTEHEYFTYTLHRPGEWPALWRELNDLFTTGYSS